MRSGLGDRRATMRAWLRPGMGVKRWLLLVFVGELCLALGGAFALRQLYRDTDMAGPLQAFFYIATLQFLPYLVRGVILGAVGAALFLIGSLKLIRALMDPFRSADDNQPLVEVETTKSAVELPSPQAGKVVRIYGGPGDKINVGEPLIVFEVPDNTAGIVGTVPKEEAPKRRVRLSAVLDED